MARAASFAEEVASLTDGQGDGLAHLYEALQGNWLPAEAYVQGNIALQFDLWIRPRDLHSRLQHKVIILQRIPGMDLAALDRSADISDPDDLQVHAIRSGFDGREGRDQGSMFVFVGQLPQRGKDMSAWAVRSVVWLADLDEPDGCGMDAPKHPVPLQAFRMAALLRRGLVEEWKGVTAGRPQTVGSDQLPNEMIERSAEVLNEITGDQAPLDWRLSLDDYEQDIARRLHVYLGDESIGLGFRLKEGPDLGVERLKMQIRSVNLADAAS